EQRYERMPGNPRMTAHAPRAARLPRARNPRPLMILGLGLGGLLLVLAVVGSVAFGAAEIAPGTVWAAVADFDPESTQHLIIRTLRLPRALVAALVGAALAVSGALMQGLTRNPLADASILGIESGAALAVVAAVSIFKLTSLTAYALFAFAGAGLTAVTVYALGSLGRGGPTPLNLTIAGAVLATLLTSLTTTVLILNQQTLETVRFWLAGSVAGRDLTLLIQAAPYLLGGLGLAFALGRQITTTALGDDVARGLGQRTGWVRAGTAVAVVLLAGGAVAVAGPISFIGLVIPHAVRAFIGADYRWILPYAALCGAIFLIVSDVAARMLLRPLELPVGIMTALIGGPFFVYLVRWRVKR
ncbi:MAG TPA: iron ABC transporter permease, partial [Herpetosiphonaceae bacterium]|nr:iron ABC transporter permease [Herpetosiphonaceae bacterium]